MAMPKKQILALFVERATRRWVVRDPEGRFWVVPFVEDAWEHRQPFEPTEETDLEPVPGHYTYLLGLRYGPKKGNL